jgi:hypothetical protein
MLHIECRTTAGCKSCLGYELHAVKREHSGRPAQNHATAPLFRTRLSTGKSVPGVSVGITVWYRNGHFDALRFRLPGPELTSGASVAKKTCPQLVKAREVAVMGNCKMFETPSPTLTEAKCKAYESISATLRCQVKR